MWRDGENRVSSRRQKGVAPTERAALRWVGVQKVRKWEQRERQAVGTNGGGATLPHSEARGSGYKGESGQGLQ